MAERKNDQPDALEQLGSNQTDYTYETPTAEILEVFPNQFPDRDYRIGFEFPEFTSLCPKTGQPDFASIEVEYIADDVCIESKSFKLYMFAHRNEGSFMETITNNIASDIIAACKPRYLKVTGNFNPRGALKIVPVVELRKRDDGTYESV